MHHERSERHVRADRAYPLDDHRERRGRVLLLGKGAVLTQRVAGPLAAELDESEQRPTRGARTCWLLLSTDAGVSARTQLTPARDESELSRGAKRASLLAAAFRVSGRLGM